jgi:hypothetical protein
MLLYVVITHTYIHIINTSIYAFGWRRILLSLQKRIDTRMVTKKNRRDTSDFIANVKFYYKNGHRD